MNKKKAFSLVELMVVLTIIAFIAAFAIPNYREYVNRAKVVATIALVEPCLNQVYQYFFKNGSLPDGASTGQVVACQNVNLPSRVPASANLNGKVSAYFTYSSGSASTQSSAAVPGYFKINLTHTDLHAVGSTDKYEFYVKLTDNNGDLQYSCGSDISNNNALVVAKQLPDSLKPSTCNNT